MRHPPRLRRFAGLLLLAVFISSLGMTSAQDKSSGQRVHFSTADGVEIHGTFYPAARQNAPTVLLIHALGENSGKKVWVRLAEEIHKNGFAVLAFDLRGHGDSTTVDPDTFWANKVNALMVKGAQKKATEIDFQGMAPAYYPVLANDIAAARAYLETRNDAKLCNVASTILIGAESGAALAALWLNAEWYRYRVEPPAAAGLPATLSSRPEGKDVIAAVWLTAPAKVGARPINWPVLVDLPARQGKTPMLFLFGDGDTAGKNVAKTCEKAIKGKEGGYRLTMATPVKDTALAGSDLLQKSLKTEEKIIEYLHSVEEAKSNDWAMRNFRKALFVWRIGTVQIPIKMLGDDGLAFDTYERFLPPKEK